MQKPSRGFQDRANVPEFEANFEKIDAFRTHKYRQFGEKEIDLTTALTNEEIEIEANGIFIKYPVAVGIRVNDLDAPLLDAKSFRYIGGFVHRIFITSAAQTPKLELLTGVNSELGFLSDNNLIGDTITGTSTSGWVTHLNWHTESYMGKKISIKNTGDTNALNYRVIGYLGNAAHYIAEGEVAKDNTQKVILSNDFYEAVVVFIQYVNAATTFEIDYGGSTDGMCLPNFTAKEDAAHVSGDYGVPALAVRRSVASCSSATNGDYVGLITAAGGHLWVREYSSAEMNASLITLALGTKAEDVASAAADKGMVSMAIRRDTPASTTDTDGDYSPLTVTDQGRLHVEPNDVSIGVGGEDTTVGSTVGSFGAQAFKKGCLIVVNDMGTTNTWIEIRIGSGKVRCTAAGQGIDWIPITNANEITVIGDGADDGKVSYTGV